MFRKTIERRVDERLEEIVQDVVTEAIVEAMAKGHSALADRYVSLAHQNKALIAAYTAAVSNSSRASERGTKAYFSEWHRTKGSILDELPGHIKNMLKDNRG